MQGVFDYTFRLHTPIQDAVLTAALAIPGVISVRQRDRRARPILRASQHAAAILHRVLTEGEVALEYTGQRFPGPMAWGDCVARWATAGEVRPWVIDGDFVLPYQREGIGFAGSLPGSHLWWPGGSGKTLALILWGLLAAAPRPVIVVTKAAARGQWASEVRRFTTLDPFVIRPGGKESLEDYALRMAGGDRRPFVILGWEAIPHHIQEIRRLFGGTRASVGFDEAHKGKSHRRFKPVPQPDGGVRFDDLENVVSSASKLSRMAGRRICTSATPVKDRRRDLWGQLDLAEPGAWGGSLCWMKRYCDARPGIWGGWTTTGESYTSELIDRLGFVVHKLSYAETHRSLPPKRRQSVYLSADEQNAPTAGTADAVRKAAKRGEAALVEARFAESASRKRKRVVEMVMESVASGGKVVVFTGRHADVEALDLAVRKEAGGKLIAGVNCWAAHGGNTTPDAREAIREKYMAATGPAVLIGTGDAWGTAYNLHDTDHAIFAMLPWTGGDLHQWEQRFSRHGQLRPVLISYVICVGTIDDQVASSLIAKLPAMEQIAGDSETASAEAALSGIENREKIAASLLAKINAIDADGIDDD
jgi:hypothetical protein